MGLRLWFYLAWNSWKKFLRTSLRALMDLKLQTGSRQQETNCGALVLCEEYVERCKYSMSLIFMSWYMVLLSQLFY